MNAVLSVIHSSILALGETVVPITVKAVSVTEPLRRNHRDAYHAKSKSLEEVTKNSKMRSGKAWPRHIKYGKSKLSRIFLPRQRVQDSRKLSQWQIRAQYYLHPASRFCHAQVPCKLPCKCLAVKGGCAKGSQWDG